MPDPRASRPYMPEYGISEETEGLLPWSWAEERLAACRNYWVATVGPDGRPHSTAVWGLWMDSAFYFSMNARSLKARNLATNPDCTVTTESAAEAVIIEGEFDAEVTDERLLERLRADYKAKYDWEMEGYRFWAVRPCVAFGFIESADKFTKAATRWNFS